MSRDWLYSVEDMVECTDRVLRYTAGMDRAAFEADDRTRDAVLRNLEILGEAAKNVPADRRAHHPEVEWRVLAGFRDVLAHEYFRLADQIVWDVVANEVAPLREKLVIILVQNGRVDDGEAGEARQ